MKLFEFDGPFMTLLRKLWGILAVGMLFLLLCVPVVTAGLSFTAMYTVVEKNLKNNRGYVASGFADAVKKNWRQALIAGTALAAALLVFEADVSILKAFLENGLMIGNMYVLIRIFQILLIVYGIWVFAQIAVYENTLRQILKNGVILMLRHLLVSFAIFLLIVFAAVVIWILPFSILFMPVVSTWLMTAILEKVFEKYGS
jgi:uncharacterized membrane protein YesL